MGGLISPRKNLKENSVWTNARSARHTNRQSYSRNEYTLSGKYNGSKKMKGVNAEDDEDENAEMARRAKPSTQTIKLQRQRRLQTQRRRATMIRQAAHRAPM